MNLPSKSITIDNCLRIVAAVPVLTSWIGFCHILHSKMDKAVIMQVFGATVHRR
jgi:hypothetical protein